jgi:hypothetical protein
MILIDPKLITPVPETIATPLLIQHSIEQELGHMELRMPLIEQLAVSAAYLAGEFSCP